MSQFFGCIALSPQINVSDVAAQMIHSMSFFQGDAIGIYQTNEVFICNKFLFNTPESINTTSICQNERYVLAAACRIDNRDEIAAKISLENPHEKSDHEYILAAYTCYQEKCVEHLIGDFSFVVWDKQEQTLFMAKDHMGIKPAFFTLQNEVLYFSTDLNAFLKITNLNIDYSKSYLATMICGQMIETEVSCEYTCYEYIHRLKPAHILFFKNNELNINEYWKLKPQKELKLNSKQEYYDKFFELFEQAVACRLRTKDFVGLELSGGLDSSAIACMAGYITSMNDQSLQSYSFVQSEKGKEFHKCFFDEEPFQEVVLEHIRMNRNKVFKNSSHPFNHFFDEYNYGFDVHGGLSKVNFTWQTPIYKQMQTNKCSVKLSGFAGDELISDSGTFWYYQRLYSINLRTIKQLLLGFKWGNYKRIINYYYQRVFGYRHSKTSKDKNKDANFFNGKYKYLLHKKRHLLDTRSYQHYLISKICRPFTTLRFETENLHALRFKSECRYPMADIRLLEFALAIPAELHNPEKINRPLIREALKSILPKVIYERSDKASAVIPYFKYKNFIYQSQMNADNPLSLLNNIAFLDIQKFNKQLNKKEYLERESDVSSLLQILFLNKILK